MRLPEFPEGVELVGIKAPGLVPPGEFEFYDRKIWKGLRINANAVAWVKPEPGWEFVKDEKGPHYFARKIMPQVTGPVMIAAPDGIAGAA